MRKLWVWQCPTDARRCIVYELRNKVQETMTDDNRLSPQEKAHRMRRKLGIEPDRGPFSEGNVSYGPAWPYDWTDQRFRCITTPIDPND